MNPVLLRYQCGAANRGRSRLSAGIAGLWSRYHSGRSRLERRLRARLPAPQSRPPQPFCGALLPAALLLATLPCAPLWAADQKNQKPPSELDRYVADAMARAEEAAPREAGSIWTRYATLSGLGLDLRAARIDDLLTIVVAEQASAVASGTVKTQRNSAANTSITALGKKTNPTSALANPFGVTGAQSLDGQGATSRETTIATTLTARVTGVLPNGYLVVEGRKVVGVNSEEQVVVVRGIVRPLDLAPDNSVASDRLAQMEVSVNGKGVLGDAIRRPNFLYRLLLGILPF